MQQMRVIPETTIALYYIASWELCSASQSRGSCPLWVKSGHRGTSNQCPLYPRKRTLDLDAKCPLCAQNRTHAPQHTRPKIGLLNRSSARASGIGGTSRRYQVSNTVRLPKTKPDTSARLPRIPKAPASPIPRQKQ